MKHLVVVVARTAYVKAKIDHNSTASHTIGVAVKGANGSVGSIRNEQHQRQLWVRNIPERGRLKRHYASVHSKRASTKQGSISGGMDLPFVNVSARSGWDSNTSIDYYFTRNGTLCGSNATWLTAAYISATA